MHKRWVVLMGLMLMLPFVLAACSGDDEEPESEVGDTIPTLTAPSSDASTDSTEAPVPETEVSESTATVAPSSSGSATPTPASAEQPEGSNPDPTEADTTETDDESTPASGSGEAMSDPTATPEPLAPVEEPENPAPELGSIDEWHNSEPLTLSELRGSTVLVVFWADY